LIRNFEANPNPSRVAVKRFAAEPVHILGCKVTTLLIGRPQAE